MENEKKAWQTPELQEMAVVVLSLHQKWWQKMAAGEKVLELRKSKPQCKARSGCWCMSQAAWA